jgi:hypothetical protein
MTTGVYQLDPQVRGRALYAMSKYNKFDDDSEHDWGVFIFAGYSFEWHIEYRAEDGTGISPILPTPRRPCVSLRSMLSGTYCHSRSARVWITRVRCDKARYHQVQ